MIALSELPIPQFQPIPFPAPVWFLKLFLVLGFYLHALPMNVALTGGLVSAGLLWTGASTRHPFASRLGGALAYSLPFFVSVAITQGIVPLLFLQLMYGPMFYTSSILMAAPWLSVIFLLLVAYYAYYVYTYRRHWLGNHSPWVLLGAGVLFMAIAFVFSNNVTLMLTPEVWTRLYQHSPYGLNLNLQMPQLLPRYLHFVIAAFAVTSLTIGCFGLYWRTRDRAYGEWLIRLGAGLFILFTLCQFPVGIWFLVSLKSPIMLNFLGAEPYGTTVFAISMGLDMLALVSMGLAWRSGKALPFKIGLAASLLVILLMVIIRHLVRVYYLQGVFHPEHVMVKTQGILLTVFLGAFVLGLIYMMWLIKITWEAFHPPHQTIQD